MNKSVKIKKYLVIGNPIEHSLSPKLHNYWIKKNNINAIYEKKEISEKNIADIISQIRNGQIDGLNVTTPFKNSIISHLDQLTSLANESQSVNTIYKNGDKIIGHNTDIAGFELAIKKINYDINGKKVFILGAGGVVPSIIIALKKMNVLKIFLSNRTKEKGENLKQKFPNIELIKWGTTPDFNVIINATKLGLKKDDEIKIDYSVLGKNKLFYDIIYNPQQTIFLSKAKESGIQTENGKMMFIYQAHQAFSIWHKKIPDINEEVVKLLD